MGKVQHITGTINETVPQIFGESLRKYVVESNLNALHFYYQKPR
jgi:hypothetical protein